MRGRPSIVLVLAMLAGCDVVWRLDDVHAPADAIVLPDSIDAPGIDAPSDPRLLARFDFEGSLTDGVSGTPAACTGTPGCTMFVTGRHGLGIALDGIDDCLKFTVALPNNLPEITVAAWVNKGNDNGQSIISKPYGPSISDSFQIDVESNRNPRFITYNGSGDRILDKPGGLMLSSWHHVAITFDGTKRLFVDGVAVANSLSETIVSDAAPLLIGCDRESGVFARYFQGTLDDVLVYHVALASSDIAALAAP